MVEATTLEAWDVLAAVAECLANVDEHVGAGAAAWLLVERLPDRVVLSVRDAGPGIPAEVGARIWEPFFRGPQARAEGGGAGRCALYPALSTVSSSSCVS